MHYIMSTAWYIRLQRVLVDGEHVHPHVHLGRHGGREVRLERGDEQREGVAERVAGERSWQPHSARHQSLPVRAPTAASSAPAISASSGAP